MIISFSYTTPPLLAGAKTFTWRHWNPRFAQQMKDRAACAPPYSILDAYDRSPRNGGKKVATIQLVSVELVPISTLTDEDYETEGLGWLARHPEHWPRRMWDKPFEPVMLTREAFDARRRSGETGYDVRFELCATSLESITVHGPEQLQKESV